MKNYQLDEKLAQNIVQKTMEIIHCNINVMNARGIIIASGHLDRVGEVHEGALVALLQKKTVEITEEKLGPLGAKPGINLPLRLEGEIVGVIGLTGDPLILKQFSKLVRMNAEMMLEQASLLKFLAQDRRLKEELILNLIQSEMITDKLKEWAVRLEIDLSLPRIACIIEIDSQRLPFAEIRQRLHKLQELLTTPDRGNLIATLSLTQFVVLKPALNRFGHVDIDEHLVRIQHLIDQINHTDLDIHFSLGHHFASDNANNLALSYHTAVTTLEVGILRYPKRQIYYYQDLMLPVLLNQFKDGWQKEELSRTINKLDAGDNRGILRKTLFAWFDNNMQAIATSQALFIHRNTLEYRLHKIAEITQLDLAKTDDKVLLYIALNIE